MSDNVGPLPDDAPYRGLTVSAILHAGIIVLTLITWPRFMEIPEPPVELPVELLPVSDETNIIPMEKLEDIRPPEPEPATEPEPEPRVAVAEPQPEPEPAPIEEVPPPPTPNTEPAPEEDLTTPTPEEAPVEEVTPREKPRPPAPPAEEPDRRSEDDIIAGLTDLEDEDRPRDRAPEERTAPADRTTQGVGAQTGLTVSEIDSFKQQIAPCWNVPAGSRNPEELVVTLRVRLNRDGSLAGMPEYDDIARVSGSGPAYRAAAESARRAVIQCAPYTLPADRYESWQEIILDFDPSRMAGR